MQFNAERLERERDLKLTSEVKMFEFDQPLEQISCFDQISGISMEVDDWTKVKKMFIKGEQVVGMKVMDLAPTSN